MHEFKKSFAWFVASIAVLFALLFVFVALLKLDSLHKDTQIRATAKTAATLALQTKQEAQRTTSALCTYKSDLEGQIDNSQQYLFDVASGRRQPVPNISRADVLASIRRQQAAVDALNKLDCPE